MKYSIIAFFSSILLVTFLLVSCDKNNLVQQNNAPPSTNQVPAGADQLSGMPSPEKDSSNIIEGEYIITYKDQFDGRISENVAVQVDVRTNQLLSSLNIKEDSVLNRYKYATKGFAAKLSKAQVELLKLDPRVEKVTPNQRFYLQADIPESDGTVSRSSSMGQTFPWGVSRVEGYLDGTGQTAWILDSGIDLDHPDLNVDIANSASFIATESADDGYGHGTHVAGIIAAINNNRDVAGVAEGASVVAVKVCHNDPAQGCPLNSIVDGVDYVAINATTNDIINMSLGGVTPATDVDDAVTAAANAGLRFTLAAGNNTINANNVTPARVEHPNVWTVSAFRQGDQFAQVFDWNTPNCNPQQSPFVGSNFGNPPVEYAAPGENIKSLWKNGGTKTTCGTSMAAPHIAGLLLAAPDDIGVDGVVNNDPDNNPDPIAINDPIVLSSPAVINMAINGYPWLSWSAVEYATSYKIYRRFEHGSWHLYDTTTNTNFTDYSQNSLDMTAIGYPGPDWSNTISYRVKAAASGVDDSPYSNTVYFSEDGDGGPIK